MSPHFGLVALSPVEEVKRLSILTMKRIMSGNTALEAEKYFEMSTRRSENGNLTNFIKKKE